MMISTTATTYPERYDQMKQWRIDRLSWAMKVDSEAVAAFEAKAAAERSGSR